MTASEVIVRAATRADVEAVCSVYRSIVNDTAISFEESLGVFRHVGYKHGSWYDVGWWQKSLRGLPVLPSEPREWRPTE